MYRDNATAASRYLCSVPVQRPRAFKIQHGSHRPAFFAAPSFRRLFSVRSHSGIQHSLQHLQHRVQSPASCPGSCSIPGLHIGCPFSRFDCLVASVQSAEPGTNYFLCATLFPVLDCAKESTSLSLSTSCTYRNYATLYRLVQGSKSISPFTGPGCQFFVTEVDG